MTTPLDNVLRKNSGILVKKLKVYLSNVLVLLQFQMLSISASNRNFLILNYFYVFSIGPVVNPLLVCSSYNSAFSRRPLYTSAKPVCLF